MPLSRSLIVIAAASIIFCACEADLQVYTDESPVTPVVYCLINPVDTTHYIRLSKTIDAATSPTTKKDVPDALVFRDVSMRVKLVGLSGDTTFHYPEQVEAASKDTGYFGSSTHSIFSFNQVMDWKGVSQFKEMYLEIEIPGLPTVKAKTDILVKPRIRQPFVNAQYLFVDKTRPLLVLWYGEAWNEVDIQFDVLEQYRDSVVTQSFVFEERTTILMKEGVCDVRFPYDLFVNNIKRRLDPRKQVIRRFMGPVLIQVHTGNDDYAYYMNTKDGINDFSGNTISRLENAIGFLGCKLSFRFDTLYFDQFTRMMFAGDPELAGLRFREF